LILTRLLRVAIASSLSKAWVLKSRRWLAVAGGVAVLQFFNWRGARHKANRRAKT